MTSYRKVPTLNGDTNYAQFGSWKSDLQAYLSRNDMQLWSSLDEAKMPDGYPPEVATWEEEAAIHDDYIDQYDADLEAEAELEGAMA